MVLKFFLKKRITLRVVKAAFCLLRVWSACDMSFLGFVGTFPFNVSHSVYYHFCFLGLSPCCTGGIPKRAFSFILSEGALSPLSLRQSVSPKTLLSKGSGVSPILDGVGGILHANSVYKQKRKKTKKKKKKKKKKRKNNKMKKKKRKKKKRKKKKKKKKKRRRKKQNNDKTKDKSKDEEDNNNK